MLKPLVTLPNSFLGNNTGIRTVEEDIGTPEPRGETP